MSIKYLDFLERQVSKYTIARRDPFEIKSFGMFINHD